MTVLHLASGRLYGGIERFLVTLAECHALLQNMAFEFAVCTEGRLSQELRERGAVVHCFGGVRLRQPSSVWRARRQLRRLMKEQRYAAAVCHAPWSHALFGGVGRSAGCRSVLWQHDEATGSTLVERRARAVPADLVICNSQWTASTASALQPRARHEVVYCAVPASPGGRHADRDALRAKLGAARSDVVVLAASRLEPWKGHMALIRALAALRARPWMLWIAGGAQRPSEERYMAGLAAEADRLGVRDRVHLLGERRDVPALLSACDVLAQANVTPEPFGVIFAEALLAGVPVVTTRMGGAPEIVGEACGRLVAPGNHEALRGALDDLIADPDLRAALGAAGPAHAAGRCAPEIILPRLENILMSIGLPAAA